MCDITGLLLRCESYGSADSSNGNGPVRDSSPSSTANTLLSTSNSSYLSNALNAAHNTGAAGTNFYYSPISALANISMQSESRNSPPRLGGASVPPQEITPIAPSMHNVISPSQTTTPPIPFMSTSSANQILQTNASHYGVNHQASAFPSQTDLMSCTLKSDAMSHDHGGFSSMQYYPSLVSLTLWTSLWAHDASQLLYQGLLSTVGISCNFWTGSSGAPGGWWNHVCTLRSATVPPLCCSRCRCSLFSLRHSWLVATLQHVTSIMLITKVSFSHSCRRFWRSIRHRRHWLSLCLSSLLLSSLRRLDARLLMNVFQNSNY